MYLSSHNEWDPLLSVFVGTATNAHWPVNCPTYRSMEETTSWKETPLPSGLVEQHIVDEANEDLNKFCRVLENRDISVHRPIDMDFQSFDGMYNYCPRDRLLIIGNKVIDCPMLFPTRMPEIDALSHTISNEIITCDDPEAMFDAANVCRMNKDILFLVSSSGNYKGAQWLQKTLGDEYKVHIIDNLYSGVHIDSTIVPLREGLVMLNASRVNSIKVPKAFANWDKIWIHDCDVFEQQFYKYPYCSKYIGMNVLSLGPELVVCDPLQVGIREKIESHGIETIGVHLRHSRTLGGGHHCTTLDMLRFQI